MPTLFPRLVALGVLVLLAPPTARDARAGRESSSAGDAPAGPASAEPAPSSRLDAEAEAVAAAPADTQLSTLRADPLAWIGRRVRFVLQLQAPIEEWNPCLTRFGTEGWVAFGAWSDERFTWDPGVHADPFRRLFARRGSGPARVLAEAHPYQRFEVVGSVREIFLDDPWIEVESLRTLEELVGEGTILHVERGRAFMRDHLWALALQQFERAGAAPLPAHARAELERQVLECTRAHEASQKRAARR